MKGKELALKYLGLRARTVFEMRKYLLEKNQPLDDIEVIIEDLSKAGYLDDEKFAIDYILYGRSKNRGQIRITKELTNKGVIGEIIEDALIFLEVEAASNKDKSFSERDKAEELSLMWAKGQKIDEKLLRKTARKLGSLGYDSDTIYGVIGSLMAMESEHNGCD